MNFGMPQNGYQFNPYINYPQNYQQGYQPQQPQQRSIFQRDQNPSLSGRYISDPKEIAAAEVPMDGTVGYFPTTDQKFIYAKAWNADGKIETGLYKLVTPDASPESIPENPQMTDILDRLDRIEKMLSPRKTTVKKGDAADE